MHQRQDFGVAFSGPLHQVKEDMLGGTLKKQFVQRAAVKKSPCT